MNAVYIAPDCPAWAEEAAREDARRRGVPVYGRGITSRQRTELALRAKSPKRANPGKAPAG